MDCILEAKNISKSFGELKVLKDVSLSIKEGEIVSIVGPSGAGKTTLLQILSTLANANSGELYIAGTQITNLKDSELCRFRNKTLGFVFQFHQLLPEFTALENVMIPALIARRPENECKEKAREILMHLGLGDRIDHKPNELSGGEKQRVAVARALINNPKILFADEPTGSLDTKNRDELQHLFFQLRDELGITIVIVTHDMTLAGGSDRVIKMKDGKIIED